MKNYKTDIERRVEVIARVMNGEKLSKADLAYEYETAEITINRDLSELRALGIQIYSSKNTLIIKDAPSKDILNNLASEYIPVKLNSSLIKSNIEILSRSNQVKYFELLIILTYAAVEKREIEIKYNPLSGRIKTVKVYPIKIKQDNMNWVFTAVDTVDGKVKTYYLTRIISLDLTEVKFNLGMDTSGEEELYDISLRFSSSVKRELIDKIWFEEFDLTEKDDSLILTTRQPITNHLASWCISWWDTIQITKPKELRDYTNEMIDYFQKKNLN